MTNHDDGDERSIAPDRVGALIRPVLAAAGLAGIGISAYVVVARKDGTATAALIVSSVVLLLIASVGDRITSLKYGDVEIDLAASFLMKARAARARGDAEAEANLVGAALDAAGISSGLSSAIDVTSTRRLHRDAVFNALAALGFADVTYAGTPIDGFASKDGVKIAVDVRAGPKSAMKSIERLQKLRARGGDPVHGLLVVVPIGKDARLRSIEETAAETLDIPVRVIRWTGDDASADDLEVETRALFEALRAP